MRQYRLFALFAAMLGPQSLVAADGLKVIISSEETRVCRGGEAPMLVVALLNSGPITVEIADISFGTSGRIARVSVRSSQAASGPIGGYVVSNGHSATDRGGVVLLHPGDGIFHQLRFPLPLSNPSLEPGLYEARVSVDFIEGESHGKKARVESTPWLLRIDECGTLGSVSVPGKSGPR